MGPQRDQGVAAYYEALRLYHVVLENFSDTRHAALAAERIAGTE